MSEQSTAENDAGIQQAAEPCWYPEHADGYHFEWGDGTPHWQSEDEGREGMASILKQYNEDYEQHPILSLRRETEPCWHLVCDECGYRYDEDEWVSHFMSKADAEAAADDCDWHVVEGRLLCSECVISPHDATAEGEA